MNETEENKDLKLSILADLCLTLQGYYISIVSRMTGTAVAIKVIDKMRFPTKQEAALKNEVR